MTKSERENFGKDIAYLIQKAVDIEREKWTTAVMNNVDNVTWNRIRNAKITLDKPTL